MAIRMAGERFEIVMPTPPPGYEYSDGRLAKIQQTNRPSDVWPELWHQMSKRQRQHAMENSKKKREKMEAAIGRIIIPRKCQIMFYRLWPTSQENSEQLNKLLRKWPKSQSKDQRVSATKIRSEKQVYAQALDTIRSSDWRHQ